MQRGILNHHRERKIELKIGTLRTGSSCSPCLFAPRSTTSQVALGGDFFGGKGPGFLIFIRDISIRDETPGKTFYPSSHIGIRRKVEFVKD